MCLLKKIQHKVRKFLLFWLIFQHRKLTGVDWRCSSGFNANFEQISHIVLTASLLTLNVLIAWYILCVSEEKDESFRVKNKIQQSNKRLLGAVISFYVNLQNT